MFSCIQRFFPLIVPMVRSSFRIATLWTVIESHSLSIRTGTNQQGKQLFVMAVRSSSGDTLPGNLTIILSGQKWVFHSIDKYAFPLLYSVQVCARNRLVLTDEDPSEYFPMENLIITENHFKNSNVMLCICTFHGIWMALKQSFVKTYEDQEIAKVISMVSHKNIQIVSLHFSKMEILHFVVY